MNKKSLEKFINSQPVNIIITGLIIISVTLFGIEHFYVEQAASYHQVLLIIEYFILIVFTLEYSLRLYTAPKKIHFMVRPTSIIDLLAILPNYIELLLPFFINTTALRGLRLMRLLRVFKLFRYGKLLKSVIKYEDTILQSITPIILLMIVSKSIVWILEYYKLWFINPNLGELFAIIGFALGIILSQKIGVTYDKFIQVEEAAIRIYGSLQSLTLIIVPNICQHYAKEFVANLKNQPNSFTQASTELYKALTAKESMPAELAVLHGTLSQETAFCLSKKNRLTPKAYDILLHQSTLLYLVLIVIFIPGVTGLISVIVATYILYGMYNVTQDLDSILGGEFNLININISELEHFSQTHV